jgi:hypothetical protein
MKTAKEWLKSLPQHTPLTEEEVRNIQRDALDSITAVLVPLHQRAFPATNVPTVGAHTAGCLGCHIQRKVDKLKP